MNPSLAQAQSPVDPYFQQLQIVPRPRPVRFRFQQTYTVALVFFAVLLVAVIAMIRFAPHALNRRNGSPPFVAFVVFTIAFIAVFVIPYFRDKRNIPLLRDGELALAQVTYQQNIQQGKASYSRIGYEFKTTSGQLYQDQAKDLTYAVFEDMTIPVFYDPLNPARNVALCATNLRIPTDPF